MILERQHRTIHDQMGGYREPDKPQRVKATMSKSMSKPRQDEPNQGQNKSKEPYLFNDMGHHYEQADAPDDDKRESVKELACSARTFPQHRTDWPDQQRQRCGK